MPQPSTASTAGSRRFRPSARPWGRFLAGGIILALAAFGGLQAALDPAERAKHPDDATTDPALAALLVVRQATGSAAFRGDSVGHDPGSAPHRRPGNHRAWRLRNPARGHGHQVQGLDLHQMRRR